MESKQYINEVWKPIRGWENLYEVSNFGRVRSVDRDVVYKNGRTHHYKGTIIKPKNDSGYLRVKLVKNGYTEYYLVHRLVAIAFIPNPNNLPEVNHKDEDKTNNVWTNLEWVDRKTNMNYGTRNKRVKEKLTNGKKSKPVLLTTKHGIYLHEWPSVSEASRCTGIGISTISHQCNKKYKSTLLPFDWKYKSI